MGYLDEYGETDVRYEKVYKLVGVALVASVLLGLVSYVVFRNWPEEQQARKFLSLLEAEHYDAAYELWGCSVNDPCRFYPYDEFLEDWGPDSPVGKVERFELGRAVREGSGVIIEIEVNGQRQPELWIEKESKIVGFSPVRLRDPESWIVMLLRAIGVVKSPEAL